jgi:hypothetical protein
MNNDDEVIVITCAKNIIKACEYLKINYISHNDYPGFDLIKLRRSVKSEITKLLETIGEDELHFSHTQFAVYCFILISEATRKRKDIFFHDFEFVYTRVKWLTLNIRNLQLLVKYHAIKNIYKVPLQLGMSGPGANMICLDLSILRNKEIKVIHDKSDYFNQTVQLFKSVKLNNEAISTLFIAQTFDDINFFKKDNIDEVIKVLNDERIHVKMHPKLENTNLLEKCQMLPSYLPVEFFFSNVRNCVVSFHSASLVTASQFDNLKVISLLDIVGIENEFTEKVKDDLLIKSKNRILFPQNISEFTTLIYDKIN